MDVKTMLTIGRNLVFGCLAAGCGTSRSQRSSAPASVKASQPTRPMVRTPAPPVERVEAPEQESDSTLTVTPVSATDPAPAEATPTADPGVMRAVAEVKLLGKDATSVGTMNFEQHDTQVVITGRFMGLPPGTRAIQIHQNGDCSGKNAKAAGPDFNPTKVKHGQPSAAIRHAGDFGNITVDKDGNATFDMTTDSLTVKDGTDSVVKRSVLIMSRKDDGKSQPSGNAGPAIACGVITLQGASE